MNDYKFWIGYITINHLLLVLIPERLLLPRIRMSTPPNQTLIINTVITVKAAVKEYYCGIINFMEWREKADKGILNITGPQYNRDLACCGYPALVSDAHAARVSFHLHLLFLRYAALLAYGWISRKRSPGAKSLGLAAFRLFIWAGGIIFPFECPNRQSVPD